MRPFPCPFNHHVGILALPPRMPFVLSPAIGTWEVSYLRMPEEGKRWRRGRRMLNQTSLTTLSPTTSSPSTVYPHVFGGPTTGGGLREGHFPDGERSSKNDENATFMMPKPQAGFYWLVLDRKDRGLQIFNGQQNDQRPLDLYICMGVFTLGH